MMNMDTSPASWKRASVLPSWPLLKPHLRRELRLLSFKRSLVGWERDWLNGTLDQMMRTEARRKSNELLALAGLISV